jgi:uncharacterized heparinase superfamily protein
MPGAAMSSKPDIPALLRARGLTAPSWEAARNQILAVLFRSPAYRFFLRAPVPDDIAVAVADPWPGDNSRGLHLINGDFRAAGQSFALTAGQWSPAGATPGWRAELAGFSWLRNLQAVATEAARLRARDLVTDWLDHRDRWDPMDWRADVLGSRIAAWISHHEWLTQNALPEFRERMRRSLAAQCVHLSRTVAQTPDGGPRFTAIKGLVYAGWCLNLGARWTQRFRARALAALSAEVARQINPDGGQIERSPAVHVVVLRELVEMRGVLRAAGAECPGDLQTAIDRMAPCLRFYRHGDEALALFNDSNEDEAWHIDQVLMRAESAGKAPNAAPHTGFQRLSAGRTLLIVDAGPPARLDGHAHAGALSFEMSVGKERLVVNCGAHAADASDWRRAQRATAAHSTLSIDDRNSCEILGPCGLGGGTIGRRPRHVTATRDESDGNLWLELEHDGYEHSFSRLHRRRLWLAATGEDLRGEDLLVPTRDGAPGAPHRFCVRFHLHPKVQASLAQDGTAALLKLASGIGWRLRVLGGDLALGDSIYLGKRGEMKRAQQIMISGPLSDGETLIRWSFRREGAGR